MAKWHNEKKNCFWKCACGTFLYLFIVVLLLFITCFVIVPFVFKYSVGVQESLVFPTYLIDNDVNYSDFKSFGLKGVRNLYINVDPENNITLGLWEILPEFILTDLIEDDRYNYEGLIREKRINILLYLHGNGHDRTGGVKLYKILRKYFLILACDYRAYGDSSKAPLRKDGIVSDISFIYKWIRNQTESRIFIWGHSLGTGVGTELISHLRSENHVPSGLILEAPFTSIIDVMMRHPVIKVFSWLPWYRMTLINPIIDNNLNFDPAKHIVNVGCPIMILHAKDDSIIPYDMAEELYEIATTKRNMTLQGNVTLYLFEAVGYDHMWIYRVPELPEYIEKFVEDSAKFENTTNYSL